MKKLMIFSAFSFAHVYFVVIYYLKHETYWTTTSELQWPIELPDVTICSNSIRGYQADMPKAQRFSTKKNELHHIRLQSFKDDTKYMKKWDSYLAKNCHYTDYDVFCRKEYHKNYFYGVCETISAGERREGVLITGLKFEGTTEIRNHYEYSRQQVLVIVLHKPGTEPIFLKENIIEVDLYSDVTISIRKRKINRRFNCFDAEKERNELVLNFENRTEYSYEACLTNCFQNFTLNEHKCILPQFYFKENDDRKEICTGVRGNFSVDVRELCTCKPLCDDYDFEVDVKSVKRMTEEGGTVEMSKIQSPWYKEKNLRFVGEDKDGTSTGGDFLGGGFGGGGFGEGGSFNEGYGGGSFNGGYGGGSFGGGNGGGSFINASDGESKGEERPGFSTGFGGFGNGGGDSNSSNYETIGGFGGSKKIRQKRYLSTILQQIAWTVKVHFESAQVTVIEEKAEFDEPILVGTIGGVLCLWLGTSVMATLRLLFLEIKVHLRYAIFKGVFLYKNASYCQLMRAMLLTSFRLAVVMFSVLVVGHSTRNLTQIYLDYPEVEHSGLKFSEQFPSVTVCSGVPIVWNGHEGFPPFNAIGLAEFESVLHEVSVRSEEQRTASGLQIEEYIRKCEFSFRGNRQNCSLDDFVQFNNHRYGNCATFNHGSLNAQTISQPIDELEMSLSWDQIPVSRGTPVYDVTGLIVHLHPRGTAPLFTPKTTHIVRKFSFSHMAYEAIARHNTKCVSEYDAEMRWKNVYQDEKRQYLHSFDSCMESCFQNISYEEPACAFCYKSEMLGKYSPKEKSTCTSLCPFVEQDLLTSKCNCQPSCDSSSYSVQIFDTEFKEARPEFWKKIEVVDGYDYYEKRTLHSDGNCGFKVYPISNIERETFFAPKMNLVILIALISGIISLLQPALFIIQWATFVTFKLISMAKNC